MRDLGAIRLRRAVARCLSPACRNAISQTNDSDGEQVGKCATAEAQLRCRATSLRMLVKLRIDEVGKRNALISGEVQIFQSVVRPRHNQKYSRPLTRNSFSGVRNAANFRATTGASGACKNPTWIVPSLPSSEKILARAIATTSSARRTKLSTL